MDPEPTFEEVKDVLLAWINTFPLEEKATALRELNDGHTIWEALRETDPDYFTGALPEGTENEGDWASRQRNLEHISDTLFSYITTHGGQCSPPRSDIADLERVAQDGDVQEMVKFMKLVFLGVGVCPLGPRKDECQQRMATLEESTMLELGNIMADVPTWAMPLDSLGTESSRTLHERQDNVSAPSAPSARAVDSDLFHEAQAAELRAENSKLKHDVEGLRKLHQEDENKYSRLQENHESLKEELAKTQDTLQMSVSVSRGDTDPSIKLLQTKIQEKDEIISDKDHESFELREKLHKNTRDLQAERARIQEFKDELDVLRSERDNFAKKANTLEKYKQKVQSSQQNTDQLREEISQLRKENDVANEALKHHSNIIDQLRKSNTKLELEHNEYRPALSRSEQHNHDLQKAKKRLEFDNAELAQRLHSTEEREQALLRELGEDRRDFVTDQSPRITSDQTFLTEFGGETEGENQLQLASVLLTWTRLMDLSRRDQTSLLEAEHRETQQDRDAQVSALRTMLDNAHERQKLRDEKYFETYHEKLQLESSLKQIQAGKSIEGSKSTGPPVMNITHEPDSTDTFEKKSAQLENEKKKRAEIEAQLRDAIRQVDASRHDLALVDMDKLKMLEEVKKQNSAALTELQKQHKVLQGNYKEMENDLDDHKAVLRKSIDERASTQGPTSSTQDLESILEVVKAATAERFTNSTGQDAIAKRVESLAEIITKDREGVFMAKEIEERDARIKDLEAKLQQQQQANADAPPQYEKPSVDANQQSYTANLERENKLMASAYHTLASRLQMTNVVMLRRNDMDTSWLNKQRRLVEQTLPGRSA